MLRRQAAETDAKADAQTVSSVLVGSLESVQDRPRGDHADILDRLARLSERIRPYSLAAIGIAVASFAVSTLIRIAAGWGSSELLFAAYVPAILGAGLLAGVPAASGVAMASILVLTWAFGNVPTANGSLRLLQPMRDDPVSFETIGVRTKLQRETFG